MSRMQIQYMDTSVKGKPWEVTSLNINQRNIAIIGKRLKIPSQQSSLPRDRTYFA